MESVYQPKNTEDRIYKFWEEKGYFYANINPHKKPFSLVIPPPNITGILHMGHVLDNTPQDIMVRFRRMQGYESCWVPGTDHAGIATQNAVEKALNEENLKRDALGRNEFVRRVWQWKEKYGNTIIQQLKKLGCSCDWKRLRFTMDEDYSNAVKEAFLRLYEKALVYQGNYIINWCPRCQTALSDEEVEHEQVEGGLYWIKYPLMEIPNPKSQIPNYVVVATTRPETMLGDTAVVVHPQDSRYKNKVGKTLILPLVNREIPIIADEIVERDFGSGAVKVTPAHDPNDFMIAQRHNLAFINIMTPDARMNENTPVKYQNLDRFSARKEVIRDLSEMGLLEKQEKYLHSVGHCYRCETMIEPYLSMQWFVRMKPLAEPAIKSVHTEEIRFYPEHWTKVYLNWLENIRDWCISRQLWWGHRIPVWYCSREQNPKSPSQKGEAHSAPVVACPTKLGGEIRNPKSDCPPIVSRETPDKCPKCGNSNLIQDPDVLDTWFSSWLWPFAVFGWDKEIDDLRYFYPTSVLNSGKDIIFFWVARMVIAGYEFTDKPPFRDIYIHGIARDSLGRKLSKSLGNSPDPLDLIDKYGADALRFGLMANIPLGGDINLSEEVYESGRNFCNKLWNASRLVLTPYGASISGVVPLGTTEKPTNERTKELKNCFEDKWILSRLNTTIRDYTNALETYEFSQAAHIIYHFFWSDLCDWYLEIIKTRLYSDDKTIAEIIPHLFSNLLRLLHPFIPFITEALWQKFREHPGYIRKGFDEEALIIAQWPKEDTSLIEVEAEKTMDLLIGIIRGVRNIRNNFNIDRKQKLRLVLSSEQDNDLEIIRPYQALVKYQANLDRIEYDNKRPSHSATEIVGALKLFIPLEAVIDIELERKRLQTRLLKVKEQLEKVRQKLANKDFTLKAPESVIEKEQQKLQELTTQSNNLEEALGNL
jgi:valyl-tRNA synthetase